MSVATASSLISEALLEAGDTSLSARALIWMNDWLRSQYAAWAWPFLKVRASGLSLTAGAASLTVGAGSGGVSNLIHRIFPPISLYKSDLTLVGKAQVMQIEGSNNILDDENLINTTTYRGLPDRFKMRGTTTDGQWVLVPFPLASENLLVAFDYQLRPAAVTSGQTPAYPNDDTIKRAIIARALSHMYGPSSPEAMAALELLAKMTTIDRMKFGVVAGSNDKAQLASDTFR